MSDKSHNVTRRQFLNYTLTGVGGFMAAGMLLPMVRFAIDPLLQDSKAAELQSVVSEDELTETPKKYQFKVPKVDGWHKFDETKSAYIFKNDGKVLALSPICTHLGCTVSWASDPAHPNQYHCPCHGGRYTKTGINIPGTPPPAPLHVYDTTIKDGTVYLGEAHPRKGSS